MIFLIYKNGSDDKAANGENTDSVINMSSTCKLVTFSFCMVWTFIVSNRTYLNLLLMPQPENNDDFWIIGFRLSNEYCK